MQVDLVDPEKLAQARQLLGTSSTKATLDLALELLLAQSDFIETDLVAAESALSETEATLDWE